MRHEELIPLPSRIRTRLATEAVTREELTAAGNASPMTRELRQTLGDHAGHYRILVAMSAELLMSAAQHEVTALDETLYLQVYSAPERSSARPAPAAR